MTGSVVPERLNWMIVHELVHILGEHEPNVLYYCLMNVTVTRSFWGLWTARSLGLTSFNRGVICLSTRRMRAQNAVLFDRLPCLSLCGSFAVAVLSAYCCIKLSSENVVICYRPYSICRIKAGKNFKLKICTLYVESIDRRDSHWNE